jgi:hypothetical protein
VFFSLFSFFSVYKKMEEVVYGRLLFDGHRLKGRRKGRLEGEDGVRDLKFDSNLQRLQFDEDEEEEAYVSFSSATGEIIGCGTRKKGGERTGNQDIDGEEVFLICPGFIDIHNHGLGGCESVLEYWLHDHSLSLLPKYGTTTVLASVTLPKALHETTVKVLETLEKVSSSTLLPFSSGLLPSSSSPFSSSSSFPSPFLPVQKENHFFETIRGLLSTWRHSSRRSNHSNLWWFARLSQRHLRRGLQLLFGHRSFPQDHVCEFPTLLSLVSSLLFLLFHSNFLSSLSVISISSLLLSSSSLSSSHQDDFTHTRKGSQLLSSSYSSKERNSSCNRSRPPSRRGKHPRLSSLSCRIHFLSFFFLLVFFSPSYDPYVQRFFLSPSFSHTL